MPSFLEDWSCAETGIKQRKFAGAPYNKQSTVDQAGEGTSRRRLRPPGAPGTLLLKRIWTWDVEQVPDGVAGASGADQAGLRLAVGGICAVSGKLGIGSAKTLRTWVRRAEVDIGRRPGVTSEQSEERKRLKRENAELRRATEMASSGQRKDLREFLWGCHVAEGLAWPAVKPVLHRLELRRRDGRQVPPPWGGTAARGRWCSRSSRVARASAGRRRRSGCRWRR